MPQPKLQPNGCRFQVAEPQATAGPGLPPLGAPPALVPPAAGAPPEPTGSVDDVPPEPGPAEPPGVGVVEEEQPIAKATVNNERKRSWVVMGGRTYFQIHDPTSCVKV